MPPNRSAARRPKDKKSRRPRENEDRMFDVYYAERTPACGGKGRSLFIFWKFTKEKGFLQARVVYIIAFGKWGESNCEPRIFRNLNEFCRNSRFFAELSREFWRAKGAKGDDMAGRLTDAWLEELRQRSPLEEIVSEYVPLKQKGRRFWGCCPFHNEKTPSFSVDAQSQLYYCFGCHKGGTVIHFVMEMERMDFMDAVRYLAERAHLPLPERSESAGARTNADERERIYEANLLAARFFHSLLWKPEGAEALGYLYRRGLTDADIRRFGIGASPRGWDGLARELTARGFSEALLAKAGLVVQKKRQVLRYVSRARHLSDHQPAGPRGRLRRARAGRRPAEIPQYARDARVQQAAGPVRPEYGKERAELGAARARRRVYGHGLAAGPRREGRRRHAGHRAD